ncbi:UNVERIFIED_CONTAM: hypothetical protein HDU68_004372 [Siphonaria sp. JEL0065]|nr:hypothetical protein HDU68_004372 [Siphonaria sp. JEL0065]
MNIKTSGISQDDDMDDDSQCFLQGYLQYSRWMLWNSCYQSAYATLIASDTTNWMLHGFVSNSAFSIPAAISALYNLKEIWIENVPSLVGALPECLGNLQGLEWLVLSKTCLSGPLPESLASCTRLRHVDLSRCKFSGVFPCQFKNLVALEYFDVSHNELEGSLCDDAIGDWPRLRKLDLSENRFHGSLPTKLGQLTMLQQLILAKNNFVGSIPASFGTLVELTHMDVSENIGLSGALSFEKPPKLKKLKAGNTQPSADYNFVVDSVGGMESCAQRL